MSTVRQFQMTKMAVIEQSHSSGRVDPIVLLVKYTKATHLSLQTKFSQNSPPVCCPQCLFGSLGIMKKARSDSVRPMFNSHKFSTSSHRSNTTVPCKRIYRVSVKGFASSLEGLERANKRFYLIW